MIVGLSVVKDETNRYWQACLEWHSKIVDKWFVLDDHSTDRTRELAEEYGCEVRQATDKVGFFKNESKLREQAWLFMSEMTNPDDWVLVIDADEFLVDINSNEHKLLRSITQACDDGDAMSVSMRKFEMWSLVQPWYRTDGYWGNLVVNRLAKRGRYSGLYDNRKMGCSSLPFWHEESPRMNATQLSVGWLHYGYADEQDRVERHHRYSREGGHNPKHIASILTTPQLESWTTTSPSVWRGIRNV